MGNQGRALPSTSPHPEPFQFRPLGGRSRGTRTGSPTAVDSELANGFQRNSGPTVGRLAPVRTDRTAGPDRTGLNGRFHTGRTPPERFTSHRSTHATTLVPHSRPTGHRRTVVSSGDSLPSAAWPDDGSPNAGYASAAEVEESVVMAATSSTPASPTADRRRWLANPHWRHSAIPRRCSVGHRNDFKTLPSVNP